MTENAGIARLWQGFHHLSENDRDLVLALAEAAGHSMQGTRAIPEQPGGLCGTSVTGVANAKTPVSNGDYAFAGNHGCCSLNDRLKINFKERNMEAETNLTIALKEKGEQYNG